MVSAEQRITSRAVIGRFYRTLEQDDGSGYINDLGMYFDSDQAVEEYAWLGNTPALREWIGGRHVTAYRENSIEVRNKHFESSIEIPVSLLRRDKSGQAFIRIDELAVRANSHWLSLLSTLIANGDSQVCYDGQYFFDTDHSEGNSGSQSNDITVDISALPAEVHGTPTAPSVAEMQQAIMRGIVQIATLLDDQGEPMNELAQRFLVVAPMPLYMVASAAVAAQAGTSLEQQGVPSRLQVQVVPNVRLGWTDTFTVFRTDGRVKPFILQEEDGVNLSAKAEGSDFEFDNDAHQYGVDTWREAAYGYWQHACRVQMV